MASKHELADAKPNSQIIGNYQILEKICSNNFGSFTPFLSDIEIDPAPPPFHPALVDIRNEKRHDY